MKSQISIMEKLGEKNPMNNMPKAHKKQNCGNKDNQKARQFPGKFQKSTLKIVDYESFI
jgi:hypothetical protein